jgi:hypothetical protein
MKRHKANWVPVLLVLCLPFAATMAQTRSGVRSNRAVVGNSGVRLGDTAATRNFRTHSYGLSGAVSRSPSAMGYLNRHRTTANLRSSSFSLRRSSAPAGAGGYNAPAVRPIGSSIRRYGAGSSASSLSPAGLAPRSPRSRTGQIPRVMPNTGVQIPSAGSSPATNTRIPPAGSIPSASPKIPAGTGAIPSAGRIPRLPATPSRLPTLPPARTRIPTAGAAAGQVASPASRVYTRPAGGSAAVPTAPAGIDRRSTSQALRSRKTEALRTRGEKLTSLVPDTPGSFRSLMQAGDQAFRQGQYLQAARKYRQATRLERDSADALVALTFAELAQMDGYSVAALQLAKALDRYPDLLLAPLDPSALYGQDNTDHWQRHWTALERHLRSVPGDSDGHLLLGYLYWLGGNLDPARIHIEAAQRLRQAQLAEPQIDSDLRLQAAETMLQALERKAKIQDQQDTDN